MYIKLTHARIYGFGKWVDYTIDLSGGSALCIYGENESGKSTLQKFMLFMLFGLPPKQRAFYRPKTSGRMGGKLSIYDATIGNYTIERLDGVRNGAATCHTPDGNEFTEEWLKERLKGMTYKTYQSIFSFSAIDLIDLKGMKEDDLGEVLLGIGLTGSNNIHSLEKQLDAEIGQLFKPYGKKPAINQQLESLHEMFTSLQIFKAEEATYRDKISEVTQWNEKMKQLQTDLRVEKSHLYTIEKRLHAFPTLHDYHRYTAQLEGYPTEIPFPENGIKRLEKVKGKLLPLQSELSVLRNNEKRYSEKILTWKDSLVDPSIYSGAEITIQKKQEYLENKKELHKAQSAADKAAIQIDTEINQLNIGLQQEDLASIVFPFQIENTWKQINRDADQLRIEQEQLRQEGNQLKQQRNYLSNQMQELEDGLLSDERLQLLNEQLNGHKEFDLLHKLKADSIERQNAWQKNMENKQKNSRTVFIGCIILSLLAGLSAITFTLPWLFNVMVLFLIIGAGQWLWGKHTAKEMQKLFTGESTQEPDGQITAQEKEQAEQLLAQHHQKTLAYASLKEQEKSTVIQHIKWSEKKKIREDKENQLHGQIDEQMGSYPFLQHVEIAHWPEIFHHMKHLIRLDRERMQFLEESKKISENLNFFQKEVNQFSREITIDANGKSTEIQLEMLEKVLNNRKNVNRLLAQYGDLLEDCHHQQLEMKQKMSTYMKEKVELFTSAQIDSEDAFYEKANKLTEKWEIINAREKVINQLTSIFSRTDLEQLIENKTDQSILEFNQQQSQATIKKIEEQIEEIRQNLAKEEAELAAMESSESYSKTMHQYGMGQEKLNQLAREWAVLKTAKEMLAETKRNYRDKYLHKVIELTSAYFQDLTGNAYKKVYAPTDNRLFQVEANDETRYTVNELSQGTVDQLYVSLRMAIGEIMSDKHRLPFIIDDAFVHFDTIRTKRMMEIVKMIAKRQQVIIFTCKKDVIDSAMNMKVIHLEEIQRVSK